MCSAIGHVRFTPESDIKCDIWNVRFGQIVDIAESTRSARASTDCGWASGTPQDHAGVGAADSAFAEHGGYRRRGEGGAACHPLPSRSANSRLSFTTYR